MYKTSASLSGTLYIVATPIGNLDDISFRAVSILKSVDYILAEDTRHSAQLCNSLSIKGTLRSLHDHNEQEKSDHIISELQSGKSFALISDAGTPLISDPGYVLVKKAREAGITVTPIPGACALIAALSAAGVPCNSFTFVGFLPAKPLARKDRLMQLKTSEHTVILYESTHRILACVDDIIQIYGAQYEWVLAKELTKSFERIMHNKAEAIQLWLQEEPAHCKGEFVLILPPLTPETSAGKHEALLKILLSELPVKQAAKIASLITKESKNELYKEALSLNAQSS